MKTVMLAAQAIKLSDASLMVAGGMESMTNAPYLLDKARDGYRMGNGVLIDSMIHDGLWDPYNNCHMGNCGDATATEFKFSREKLDEFAAESYRRAMDAQKACRYSEEIVPVEIPQRKGEPVVVDTDERPRRDTSMEALGKLRPAFREGGTVTAGNSSGMNDGAAALLLMSAEKAEELNLKPLARVVASAAAGVNPRTMGLGPIPATEKALKRAGLALGDIGLIELNEAFAVQALAVMKALGMKEEATNVNGGAIALGHPLGCSGARILTTLLYEMRRRAAHEKRPYYGLATLCVGVGQGEATIIEWIGD
jgi:acetyl-CoA acetyltransferase family protein